MPATPERLTRCLLLGSLFGFAYRGHWVYSADDKAGVGGYLNLAHGLGPAPHQYRIGVILPAAWAYLRWHLPFRYSFTAMDVVASVLAVMLGYELLRRTEIYRRAANVSQWFGSVTYLALALYLLCWQDNFKKAETQPAAALVMLLLWLWTPNEARPRTGWRVAGLLTVTLALSLLRAEIPLMIAAGVLVVAGRGGRLSLQRRSAMATAAACMAMAAGTQLVLAKVVYPQAHYAPGYFFMLPRDIWRLNDLACFVVFLLPTAWTLREVRRRKFNDDAAGVGLLLGTIPFVLLWMMIGRIEEVRIFLPLALAVMPLTVQMAMLTAAVSLAEPARTR